MPSRVALRLTIAFLAIAAGAANEEYLEGEEYMEYEPRATCSYPSQVVCSNDCSQVNLCMSVDGGLTPTVVETCDVNAGQRCSFSQKTCVAEGSSDCHSFVTNFTCNDPGAYPDPYDCTTYHVCLEGDTTADLGHCEVGWAYNALTNDCSLKTTDRPCVEGPIDGCTSPAQVGVVQENPAIYYVCIRENGNLFPDMRRCHHGQVFNVTTVGCTDKQED
ncbi:uncharacterized protein LOC126187910 [Schistocerca cancellata]|uniref:uncharacterized protein LOC126187910 n=1 Tax=Schistocerca cancellata TaxID=274614 RepID=UPI0021196857|nr:uncharacterized protein LOC126187910 [Schistocerca cancellata]